MLFRNFDQSHTAMRQHPVTTVAQRVRSVSKRDSADGTDDKCCRSTFLKVRHALLQENPW